ncbi:hypothetical protein F7725_020872 [Dissostichus mawsoni]|uniref:Uncharacterized protein n=1 Tax=Dissostichus mawsoni TaxID=36200 RepID=A0A7J5YEF5_DISMA|nr:hypothetical protein F7725_020872 [Dissostichus mawsoni]
MCSSTYLPMSRNSPTSPWRLMAMRMLRTVMPSQKQATTRALGRWARSRSSSRSKLCSPALLQILPGDNIRFWTWMATELDPGPIKPTMGFFPRMGVAEGSEHFTVLAPPPPPPPSPPPPPLLGIVRGDQ